MVRYTFSSHWTARRKAERRSDLLAGVLMGVLAVCGLVLFALSYAALLGI